MAEKITTSIWNRVTVYCTNHDEPQEMHILENSELFKSPFYACAGYEHKEHDQSKCSNRLNLDDYQGIVMKLIDIIGSDVFTDYKNYSFSYKGTRQLIDVKILRYTSSEIRLGIYNRTVLGGARKK